MATYDQLPVYKAGYDLLVLVFSSCRGMQRDYRYTLGESLKKELLGMVVNIYRANCRPDKREPLSQARENIEVVRLMWRLCNELKQVPFRTFVSASEKIEDISRQLTAWERSCQPRAAEGRDPGGGRKEKAAGTPGQESGRPRPAGESR